MVAEREFLDVEDAEVIDELPTPQLGTTVARREAVGGLIRPVAEPSEVLAAQEAVRELIEKALKDGRDYGLIKGTQRPTLYKPGAERINAAFGTAARYQIIEKEIDHDRVIRYRKRSWEWHPSIRGKKVWGEEEPKESQGIYRYVLLCQLVHRESGVVIGEGVGSCSTLESKYIDRPRDVENTILKMAKKRAYVDATLTTFGLSEQFTQDVEDMDPSTLGGDDRGTAGPFSLEDPVGFGKHSTKTWTQVLAEEPDYVEWAVSSCDKLTDEAKAALAAALKGGQGEGPPVKAAGKPLNARVTLTCPKCGDAEMYDNRFSKTNPKAPDFKCKDKGCGHALWMDGWERDLLAEVEAAHKAEAIDAEVRAKMEEAVVGRDPELMMRVQVKLNELSEAVA